MQASNKLRTALLEGKKVFGAWQMLPGANVSRVLARSGVDWVLVDCEHGNLDGKNSLMILWMNRETLTYVQTAQCTMPYQQLRR
jgi:2-keto-3-deoxy-L-rhamnonate aldolase RhmA